MFLIIVLYSNLLNATVQALTLDFFSTAKTTTEMLNHLWTTVADEDKPATTLKEYDKNPVFVSDYVRDCEYDRARSLLQVEPIFGVQSYSGFITVSRRYNSNLFFWLVCSQQNPTDDPLVVWLMGWPGFSSMYGAFQENGPFRFKSGNLTLNEYSWTKRYNMLYIDNPVGIGYSFSDNDAGFSRNQQQVTDNLYEFMQQFYEVFPELKNNELYVGGESSGAKFATSLAYEIFKRNPTSHTKMNLNGLFVGNGFLDPINMLEYSQFLYRLGIIDFQSFLDMQILENHIKRLILMRKWNDAVELSYQIFVKLEECGFDHPYDFTREKFDFLDEHIAEYLNETTTRNLFHVGDVPFRNHELVYKYLEEDIFQSVKLKVEELLPHLKILFYSGQFDTLVTRPNLNKFTNKLRWTDAIRFAKQQPITWRVENKVAGYVASVSNLTEVSIRNANHMTAACQPEYVFRLFNLFTEVGLFTDATLAMDADDYF